MTAALSAAPLIHAQPFPVYFADVIRDNGITTLRFDWRPDYKSYDKAVITDDAGNVVGQVNYPLNRFEISDPQEQGRLFITAVDTHGETSEPAEVDLTKDYGKLQASKPLEPIIVKTQLGGARFQTARSGREFIVKGVNYCGIRLADHDSFEPDIIATQVHADRVKKLNTKPDISLHDVTVGDPIQFYDPYRTEAVMRELKTHGYNLARVFVKTGERGSATTQIHGLSGPADTEGIHEPYMDNFLDFLTRAQKYGIYVLPCFTENEMLDNDYFKTISNGATEQGILFSAAGTRAKQHYIELFLKSIKSRSPELIDALFGLTMQNEFAFLSDEAPFNQTTGTYTFLDGRSYDMTDDDERRALANKAIQTYFAAMKTAVEKHAPGLLIGEGTFAMGAVGKTYENSKGIRPIKGVRDLRFPMTAVELMNTDIDFLDFHVYRWGKSGDGREVFNHFAENMEATTPECAQLMISKPLIMGEFGSFNFNETTLPEALTFSRELQTAALEFGFKGTCYWTLDTFEQTNLWNLMWKDGTMLKGLNAP
jgi:hypothetical protein